MTNTVVAASNRAWFYGYAAMLLLALGVILVAADGEETNENEGGKDVEEYRPPGPCKTNKGTLNTHIAL